MNAQTSSLPMAKAPSADRVVGLPELQTQIAAHLTPPDLYACVQTSRLWNEVFIPSLWHTIHDRLYGWPSMVDPYGYYHKDGWWCPHHRKTPDWTRQVMQKHGHHIRHLSIFSWIVSSVVTDIGDCRRLKTLWIDIPWSQGGSKKEAAVWPESLTSEEREILEGLLQEDVQLCKEFDSATWRMIWQLWLLIFRISALCDLRLSALESRKLDRIISPAFFRRALLVHHRTLTSLRIDYKQLDLVEYLEILPNLRRLYTGYDPVEDRPLDKTYPHLRTLVIEKSISGIAFHNLLKYLPNLEHLGVMYLLTMLDHINYDQDKEDDTFFEGDWKWKTDFTVSPLLDGIPSRLSGLHFLDVCQYGQSEFMTEVAFDVLPSLPFLTELTIDASYPDLGPMLAKYCKLLQVFRNSDFVETIHPNKLKKMMAEVNEMNELLENCPYLRIFDAIVHRIEANHLLGRPPWLCKDLEFFRCQLIGFQRLNSDEEEIYDEAIQILKTSENSSLLEEQQRVINKHRQFREQHHQVYDRLASLTKLTTLDLGHEYLNRDDLEYSIYGNNRYSYGGRTYLVGHGPILETMELSLASGLDRLGALEKLEVFGFTGVDHRIQEPELEWMAKAWPRLTVMRGIHYNLYIGKPEDAVTAELQKKMLTLRPDVKHKAWYGVYRECVGRLFRFAE
ncbi:hypothetical protein BG015_002126 [Linnemannia schmuckeri]|uniref:F-box domain-containing protein n=1 Tax=Linnemannia schmuckeri TaxID=64567 RepID=A0A9P5RP54_9FUNG|nr:hypothetical protein BG015_002126 [Linnemannia schmuckeri]